MKSIEQIQNKIKSYVNNASKHLYHVEGDEENLFKVVVMDRQIFKLWFKDGKLNHTQKMFWYPGGGNAAKMVEHDIFKPWDKHVTVRNRKQITEAVEKWKAELIGKAAA